jgi:pimeloyl-ACP methyl ester carboxylesterase
MAGSFLMVIDNTVRQTTRQVRVGEASIHVTEWGDGPPALLLHGNPDSGMMWNRVASRLGARFRCVAPDLPGFGHSEVPDGYDRSLEGMAHFVEQFLSAAEIKQPIDVVAHDFGGPFGFAWAVRHSDAVRRIVAINTLFFSDYHWHFWARVWRTPVLGEFSMAVMNRPMFGQEIRRGSGKRMTEEHIEATWALMTPSMKKEVLRLYRATNPENFKGWQDDFLGLTARKPTLVIWGDKDPYLSSRYAERFNARKVAHLPEIGHWAPVEAPAECAAAIMQFLTNGAGSRRSPVRMGVFFPKNHHRGRTHRRLYDCNHIVRRQRSP